MIKMQKKNEFLACRGLKNTHIALKGKKLI